MYTVTCDYFATGEGRTIMLLITRGYGPSDDSKENALNTFKSIFGDYYAIGADIMEGIQFDVPGAKLLLSDAIKTSLLDWEKDAGGLEYHAKIHVNFS
jgi:hypothetical protein